MAAAGATKKRRPLQTGQRVKPKPRRFYHPDVYKRQCLPDCPIGLLYSCGLVDPWLYAKHLGANALHPHYLALRAPGLAEGCKEAVIALHPWTVNTREGVLGCAKAGCQAVITNYPAMARETLGK